MKIIELGDYSMIISDASNIKEFAFKVLSSRTYIIVNSADEQVSFENTSTTSDFIISGGNLIAYFRYKISDKYRVNQEMEVTINRSFYDDNE